MTNKEIEYPTTLSRVFANFIDVFIVLLIRIFVLNLIVLFWFNNKIQSFLHEANKKFNVEKLDINNVDQFAYLMQHEIFLQAGLVICTVFFSGSIYYILMQSSVICATLGKRINKILIIDNKGKRLSKLKATAHYLCGLVPWIYAVYIIFYQIVFQVSIFQAIMGDIINLLIAIIVLLWTQGFSLNYKSTIYDRLCECSLVKGVIPLPKFKK